MSDKKFESFESSEVGDILAEISGGIENHMRAKLTEILDTGLREFLLGLVNMPKLANLGAPQVMLRVRTFQTILDDFKLELGDKYDQVLTRIGQTIGFNFAISLIRILHESNKLPENYDALLQFWAKFDSAAQMGEYTLAIHPHPNDFAQIDVSIRDLFLTLGYDDHDALRHCPFITGYFEGAVDTTMLLWNRWIRQSIYQTPEIFYSVSNFDDLVRESHGIVRFKVAASRERFPELRDHLATAIELGENKQWAEAIITGRIALERALVLLAGEEPKAKVSFGKLLEQLARVRALPLVSEKFWRQIYAECSNPAHQVQILNEVSVTRILFNVWTCVKEAEATIVAPEQQAEVKKNRTKYVIP